MGGAATWLLQAAWAKGRGARGTRSGGFVLYFRVRRAGGWWGDCVLRAVGAEKKLRAGPGFAEGVEVTGVVVGAVQEVDKKPRPNHVLFGSISRRRGSSACDCGCGLWIGGRVEKVMLEGAWAEGRGAKGYAKEGEGGGR